MRTIRAMMVIVCVIASIFVTAGPSQASDSCYQAVGRVIPSRCLDYNISQFRYTRKQLGANPYSYPALKKRFGTRKSDKNGARMAQFMTVHITHSTNSTPVPQLAMHVPLPSYKAKLVKKYRNRTYVIYQIFADTLGPVNIRATWKFGITSVSPWQKRPKS